MRILFFHTESLGWCTYNQNLRKYVLEKSIISVSFLHPRSMRAWGISKIKVPLPKKSGFLSLLYQTWFLGPVEYLIYGFKNGSPGRVHCAGHFLATGPWLFRTKATLSVTIDGAFGEQILAGETYPLHYRLVVAHEKKLLNRCDIIFTSSNNTLKYLAEHYGIEESKLVLHPMPIYGVELDDLERGLLLKKNRTFPKIAFVGNAFRRKGGHELVELFKEHFENRAELHIFSSEAPEAIVDSKNIYLYRDVPNEYLVSRYLPEMDIFVLPTHFDQTPNAIVEAMSAQLPVVSTNVGGLSEMVQDGVTGFLAEKGDFESVTEKIGYLIENKVVREQMGASGRASFKNKYYASLVFDAFFSELKERKL